MLIECLIRRDGPTHVTIDGFDYVFAANSEGRKVCEVLSSAHQSHFLALKDYIPYEGQAEAPVLNEEPEKTQEDPQDEDDVVPPDEDDVVFGKPDGTPYKNEAAAKRGAKQHYGLDMEEDALEVIEVEGGGWALMRKGQQENDVGEGNEE